MLETLTTTCYCLALLGSFLWLRFALQLWRNQSLITPLSEVEPITPPEGWPSLAVIFAARNEANMVEAAARSMLTQDYPNFRVLAVNDRSTDDTGAILDRLAATDPSLQVVHITHLPDGWLGKNHALQKATESTDAEWLLFTDADVVFEPRVFQRAITYVNRERIDHLVLAPDVITESLGERMFIAVFTLGFALNSPPWKVVDPKSKAAVGVGAFNLVRASVLRDVGGFEPIRLSIDDDVKLGQMLKFCGYKSAIITGLDTISVRWQVGTWGMITGLEKNFYAALDFKPWRLLHGTIGLLVVGVFPYVGLFVGPIWSRGICLLSLIGVGAVLGGARGQNGLSWPLVFTIPFGTLAVLFALARSIVLTHVRGGVRWRDHVYPLADLKSHVRERNAWLDEVWKSTR